MMRASLALLALLGLAAIMSSGSARNMFAAPAVAPLRYVQTGTAPVQLMGPPTVYAQAPPRAAVPQAMVLPDLPHVELPYALIAEIVDTEGERIYGAVDAPGWIAPVGGILLISTALLPVLLAPGDEAFRRQQGDEKKVKAKFGDGRGVFRDMRKK